MAVTVQTMVQGAIAAMPRDNDGDARGCIIILDEVVAFMIGLRYSTSTRLGVMVIGLMRALGLLAPEKTS